mgnify:CR=1 FL=1
MTRPSKVFRPRSLRPAALLPLTLVAAACTAPLDYDLRGQIGAFNTTKAAQTATETRPAPDTRGLITYPSYQVAVARNGDTVADLARRVGLPAVEVARFNGVETADQLRRGEVLVMPRRAPETSARGGNRSPGGVDIASLAGSAIDNAPESSPNPGSVTTTTLQTTPAKPAPTRVQGGPEPVRHKVTRGETAYTIARLYQIPVKSLAEWNGLGPDLAVREGQHLLIPIVIETASVGDDSAPGTSVAPLPPSSDNPLPNSIETATLPDLEGSGTGTPAPAPAAAPSAGNARLIQPVDGSVTRGYGSGNEGIDISASAGTPVRAAADGTVAAITQDTDQVPILVVRHADGLLTVYANIQNIRVGRGDSISRGQTVAEVGSGDPSFLHFEVRRGFEAVNPSDYLP